MAIPVQRRRGSTAQHSTFTGAIGETTVDTDKKTVVVHDGVTAGGTPLAKESDLAAKADVTALETKADVTALETKANDSAVIHNTGDEMIEGIKTFSDNTNLASINNSWPSAPRVMGLTGNVNAATPLTKYDLAANAVVLRDANGATVTRYNTGTITCDLALAGSAANGRDQAAAFTASSWIYLYFIWNGTTLATIASLSATAPTLPSGYTHYALATVLRWNASSNIIPCYTQGSRVFYDVDNGGAIQVLSAGVATSFTAVSLASLVPPVAAYARVAFQVPATHNTANILFNVFFRPTGSAISVGMLACGAISQVANVQMNYVNTFDIAVGTSQQIDYRIANVPTVSGANINVLGFTIPNGDC